MPILATLAFLGGTIAMDALRRLDRELIVSHRSDKLTLMNFTPR